VVNNVFLFNVGLACAVFVGFVLLSELPVGLSKQF
jgi:hypothetical protein